MAFRLDKTMNLKPAVILGVAVLLLALTACEEQLPPPPPPPGATASVLTGNAITGAAITGMAGIEIPAEKRPPWASPRKNFELNLDEIAINGILEITNGPWDYAWGEAWIYTDYGIWEKLPLSTTLTKDRIIQKWVKGTAKFSLKILEERFTPGKTYYAVAYGCKKTRTGWDCNNDKWMLLSFKTKPVGKFPEALIERDIEDYKFKASKVAVPETYTADYDYNGVGVLATVAVIPDMAEYERAALKEIEDLEKNTINNVYTSAALGGGTIVFWISDSKQVEIKTSGAFVPDAVVDEYLEKHPSTLNSFIARLRAMAGPVCGNDKAEGEEECDGTDDSKCRGRCLPNCKCAALVGNPNQGFCGDNVVQTPNAQGINEECEPPTKLKPFVLGGWCLFKGVIGNCDARCKCVGQIPQTFCGDGKKEGIEECENDADCKQNMACKDCLCVPRFVAVGPVKEGVTIGGMPGEAMPEAEKKPGEAVPFEAIITTPATTQQPAAQQPITFYSTADIFSRHSQLALVIMAALGILAVTLLNFLQRD